MGKLRLRTVLSAAILLVALSILLTGAARPASASSTDWFGTVDRVLDGDTFEVNWDSGFEHPEGKNRIRLVGIDTNEVATHECLAVEATTALEELLPPGTPVRLEARDLYSEALDRPLRHVFVGDDFQTNVAIELINQGLGLAASYDIEPDYRSDYYAAGEQAVVNQVGLWEENACGNTAETPSIDVTVNYDAAGNDATNINDEYIDIRNTGTALLHLNGWTLRSSARLDGNTFTLPAWVVYPGDKIRIHIGPGTDTATDKYLGNNEPWLNNESDVLYLRDSLLNMAYTQFWPCTITCGERSALVIEDVQYNAPGNDLTNPNGEWLKVRNVSGATLDLTGWRVKDDGTDYAFADGETLAPGAGLTIFIGEGTDAGSNRYWGNSGGILNNTSGDQRLRIWNSQSVEIDCFAWGSSQCTNEDIRGAIELTTNFNASGNDVTNPNGEWVALHNTSDSTVDVSGYDIFSPGHRYTFPTNTTIAAGSQLRLRVGSGSNTSFNHYWGKTTGIFNNGGDYIQLQAADNSVVLESRWPCATDCGPDRGIVIDHVNYDAVGNDATNPNGEWIVLKNVSSAPQDLRNWKVVVGGFQIVSLASRPLQPGDTVRISIGSGTNTTNEIYWGKSKGILLNSGARSVTLLSPQRRVVDCHTWGSATCANQSVSAAVSLSANFDAVGTDSANPNGEWVNINNNSAATISLDGHHIYTDGTAYFFDSQDTIEPGERLRLRLGSGQDTYDPDNGPIRYASGTLNALANGGDEVELRPNSSNATLAEVNWPCSDCPSAADVVVSQVNFDAVGFDSTNPNGEWVTFTNNETKSVNLRDWRIQYNAGTFYDVDRNLVIPAGGSLTLFIGQGTDTTDELYWGFSSGILSNSGGTVALLSPYREAVSSFDW